MQRTFRLIFLSIGMIVFLAAGTVSCRRPDTPVDPVTPVDPSDPVPFKVSLSIIDGERDLEKVIRHPEVTLTLTSENEAGNYAMTYSVNGGTSKTMKNIWSGTPKTLSTDFRNLTAYGSYTLKGYVYDVSESSLRVPIDTTVLMVYSPAEKTGLSFETLSRSGELTDGTELFEEEFGSLMLSYAPASTYLNVQAFSSNPEVVELLPDKVVNEDGLFSVGFKAKSIGKTTITFRTVNGRDQKEYNVPVDVKEDTDGKAVYIDVSHSGLVIPNVPLQVFINGQCAQTSRLFNIEYFIDGVKVKTDTDVSFNVPISVTIDVAVLSEGKHTILVRTSSKDGRLTPIDKESTFDVARPVLSFIDRMSQEKFYGDGEVITLPVSELWTVSVKSVPSEFLSRFHLVGGMFDSITGDGPWSLSVSHYGRDYIDLMYQYNGSNVRSVSLNALRTDNYNLKISYSFVTDSDQGEYKVRDCYVSLNGQGDKYSTLRLSVSGQFWYKGVCYYLKALNAAKEGGYFNEECMKEDSGHFLYFDKTAVFSSAQPLFDASWYASSIRNNYEISEYWPEWAEYVYGLDWDHADPERGQFPYTFKMESISLNISSDNDEGLTYVVVRDESMFGITCTSDDKNVKIK